MSGEWDPREEHHKYSTGRVATMPAVAKNKWRVMKRYLDKRKLDFSLARDNGWYPSVAAGDDALRIVIPATNSIRTPFWQARLIESAWYVEGEHKRYQSPHADRHDSVVIVWAQSGGDRFPVSLVIVEGPMCALAAADLGYIGVAMMGATPPLGCFDLVASLGERALVVADADEVVKATLWVAQLASRGVRAGLAIPNGKKDLADMSPKRRSQLLEMWDAAQETR